MLLTNSFLRETVHIIPSKDGIELRFSVWGIELPLAFTNDPNSRFAAFLQRQASSSDLKSEQQPIQKLLLLLLHQGCLVPANRQEFYQLSEVKALYISFCNEWYGRYYSHRLWETMRDREIPISILRQWVSRTYFLSRFAGVTASAASLNCPYPPVRQAFQKSAIEEYSHCRDYYSPPVQLFPASLGYTAGIEPLASFVAFDQQMLYIAKNDWLAHLFVALFQERTAKFRHEANHLYCRIEDQLGIDGLFDGWRTHISFDEEHSHEGDLDHLFDQNISIPCEQLQRSFEEGALTIDILVSGLGESLLLGQRGINPRVTATSISIGAHHLAGLDCFSGITEYKFQAASAHELVNEICAIVAGEPNNHSILVKFSPFWLHLVRNIISNLTAECLSQCSAQSEIIAVGQILESFSRYSADTGEELPSHKNAVRVFRNHISARSRSSSDFAFVLFLLARLSEEGGRLYKMSAEKIDLLDSLALAVDRLCDGVDVIHYLKEALAAISLMEFALSGDFLESQSPQFAMWHNMSLQGATASGRP